MKKHRKLVIAAAVLVVFFLLFGMLTFSVHEKEYVAVRQFGRIVRIESEPGL